MSTNNNKTPLHEGVQPYNRKNVPPGDRKGVRPNKGRLDRTNPPSGGSGVPLRTSTNNPKKNS